MALWKAGEEVLRLQFLGFATWWPAAGRPLRPTLVQPCSIRFKSSFSKDPIPNLKTSTAVAKAFNDSLEHVESDTNMDGAVA